MFQSLHQQALQAAKNYFEAESSLLEILQKIDSCKGYKELGYTSLYTYTTGALKLPEGTAYNLINVARKAREFPALKTEIDRGELSISNARRIVPVLTLENQKEWIEKAKSLPQRALEREVAKVRPELATPEKTKYVSENRLNLSLGISQKLLERIQRIQDLESQRTKSAASLEDALEAMAEIYLHRNDPLEKAKRAKPAQLVLRQVEFKREPIPAGVGHQVRVRDLSQCTDVKNGIRCTNRRWLEIHHLKPVSQGGSNEVDNLTTLCQAHHRIEHRLDTPRRA